MGKVLCTAADMTMGMHDANAIEQLAVLHIHADLAENIGDNLNKFVNKFISRRINGEPPRL